MNKKAVSVWISWILILALAITISAFMYSWITSTTETATESFRYVYDRSECDNVAVMIESCNQTQTLNTNVTNKLMLAVDGLIFRIHYSDYESDTKNVTVKLNPGEKEDYLLPFDNSKTVAALEVIPIIQTEDYRIICRSRIARIDDINSC